MIAFKSAVLHLISIKHKPAVKQLLYQLDTSQESSAESELQTDICSALSWGCELGGVPVHSLVDIRRVWDQRAAARAKVSNTGLCRVEFLRDPHKVEYYISEY